MRRRTEAILNSRFIKAKSTKRWFFTDFASFPATPTSGQIQTQSRFVAITETPPLHNYHLCIIVSFSLNDPDLVTIAEQIGNLQVTNLADTQASGIGRHEQSAMFGIEIWTPKELHQLLHTIDPGAQDRFLHARDGLLDGFGRPMQDLTEEETKGA